MSAPAEVPSEVSAPAEVSSAVTAPAEMPARLPDEASVEQSPQADTGAAAPDSADLTDPLSEAAPVPGSALGSITIDGAAGWLVGPAGRVAPGAHPAGDYEVMVTVDDAPQSLGRVTLTDGVDVKFRCGFGTCKRIQ